VGGGAQGPVSQIAHRTLRTVQGSRKIPELYRILAPKKRTEQPWYAWCCVCMPQRLCLRGRGCCSAVCAWPWYASGHCICVCYIRVCARERVLCMPLKECLCAWMLVCMCSISCVCTHVHCGSSFFAWVVTLLCLYQWHHTYVPACASEAFFFTIESTHSSCF